MELFDEALDSKIHSIPGVLADWGKSKLDISLLEENELTYEELSILCNNAPLAVVTSDIISIAEEFPLPFLDEPVLPNEKLSPLLFHYVYLERSSLDNLKSFFVLPLKHISFLLIPLCLDDKLVVSETSDNMFRVMRGIVNLSSQFIEKEVPLRAQRRRAIRSFPTAPNILEVVILRLRQERRSAMSKTPSESKWSHRWIVRGHFRRLPDRIVYVDKYVKGPKDKPLVIKDHRILFDR